MSCALVFGGGGGKGAYEIGVWKALREWNLEQQFTSVLGTSVGGLNALLFAQQNFYMAQRIWQELSHGQILSLEGRRNGAVFDQKGLRQLLETNITGKLDKFVYVCCSRIEKHELGELFSERNGIFGMTVDEKVIPEYIKLNGLSKEKQIQYLLASAALPMAFDQVEIEGRFYRDGGLIREHNLPVKKAADLGFKKILAVSLEPGFSGARCVDGAEVFTLHPSRTLGELMDGTLDFDAANASWRMELGYHDSLQNKTEICRMFQREEKSFRIPEDKLKKFLNNL